MTHPTLITPLILWDMKYGREAMSEEQRKELEEFERMYCKPKEKKQ